VRGMVERDGGGSVLRGREEDGGGVEEGLPPLPRIGATGWEAGPNFRGPTAKSNWVVPGRVLAGAYPASRDDEIHERLMSALVEGAGVTMFVCLMNEVDPARDAGRWRDSERFFRPYMEDARRAARRAGRREPAWLQLRVEDGTPGGSGEMEAFLADYVVPHSLAGEHEEGDNSSGGGVVYVHCRMGNGRTGVACASLLGMLYPSLSCDACLTRLQLYHGARKVAPDLPTPQTSRQRDAVAEILAIHRQRRAGLASP